MDTRSAEELRRALAWTEGVVTDRNNKVEDLTKELAVSTRAYAALEEKCAGYWKEILYLRERVEALVEAPVDNKSTKPEEVLPRKFGEEDFDVVGRPALVRRLVEAAEKTTGDAPGFVLIEAITQLGAIPENRTLRGYSTDRDMVGVHVGDGKWEEMKPDDVAIVYEKLLAVEIAKAAEAEPTLRVGSMTPRVQRGWAAGQGGNAVVDLAVNNAAARTRELLLAQNDS